MDTLDLLIFDLDGTLIDASADIAAAVNLSLQEIGLPPKPPELLTQAIGCGIRWLLEQAAAHHRTLMIGDGVNDTLAARAAGVRCRAVTYSVADPAPLLRENPDFICHSFREIQAIKSLLHQG